MKQHAAAPASCLAVYLAALAPPCVSAERSANAWPPVLVGKASLQVRRDGGIVLLQGKRVLVSNTRVTIAAPGWCRSVSQSACKFVEGYPKQDGRAYVFRGDLAGPGTGVV